ncbi:MAG TPA: DUF4032 domain-containing protein [Egibacteraceae bacterium]|nr:DUF4032 domain-containing protein [Egibacteraceae bacterium]
MAINRGLRIVARPGHPDFLDLPWDQSLDAWHDARIVDVPHGIHRHVVQFIDYDGVLYALKELQPRVAQREYAMLRKMAEEEIPVVEVVGVVERSGLPADLRALDDVLITRYLDYSLPYRALFINRRSTTDVRGLHDRLIDSLAMLLVRLHLSGFFWGDCSLSNTLFRRDAGALAAYLVDAETGEWHPTLSRGQREEDLDIAELNVIGGLLDLQAQLDLPPDPDPEEMALLLRRSYTGLWEELTTEVVIGRDERYKIEARLRRLNELGFDVDEMELVSTDEGDRLVLKTSVSEKGHHRRRLLSLTGLEAQENQARVLLNDLANFRLVLERNSGRPVSESIAAHRWMNEVFEPSIRAIPDELRGKLEPVEIFHEIIEHKWFASEAAGRDIGIDEAVASYIDKVLPAVPDERTLLDPGLLGAEDSTGGWMSYG